MVRHISAFPNIKHICIYMQSHVLIYMDVQQDRNKPFLTKNPWVLPTLVVQVLSRTKTSKYFCVTR